MAAACTANPECRKFSINREKQEYPPRYGKVRERPLPAEGKASQIVPPLDYMARHGLASTLGREAARGNRIPPGSKRLLGIRNVGCIGSPPCAMLGAKGRFPVRSCPRVGVLGFLGRLTRIGARLGIVLFNDFLRSVPGGGL